MVQSQASTVRQYLDELPAERRAVVAAVRKTLRRGVPKGYVETMNCGLISYEVPLSRFPDTYNGRTLSYAGLATQKNHYDLYLMCTYGDPARETRLRKAFQDAGKTLDMDKACVGFQKLEDIPLDAICELLAETPPDDCIARYESLRRERRRPTGRC